MQEIPLTQGKVALVDDEDYELVAQYKWHAHVTWDKKWYAKTHSGKLTMHKFLLNPPSDMEVDHVNGDGLDNRRQNLRICNSTQNKGNMRKQDGRSSIYKGVSWDKSRNK